MTYDCTQPIHVRDGICVRPFLTEEAETLYHRFQAERETTALRWIGSIDRAESVEYVANEIERVNGLLRESKRLGGAIEVEGQPVGSCRLAHIEIGKTGDLGYWIFDDYRGKGIVTDCSRAVINVAFEHLALGVVTICASTTNPRSCGMAERLGFTYGHTVENSMTRYGVTSDTAVYYVTKSQWQSIP
jgi:ribosomal-protein-serine acetyltransferase